MLTALGWWWHTPHDLIEHIDPDNLTRDTKVILQVLARLLTDRLLPLDYGAYAESPGGRTRPPSTRCSPNCYRLMT